MQELSSDDFEGKQVLVGPIVHITFTAKVELRDPSQVSLTCPISIRVPIGSQQDKKLLGTSSWRVRVYFRGGGDTLRKWIDRAEELKVPPKLQDGIVTLEVDGIDTFRIDHFSE